MKNKLNSSSILTEPMQHFSDSHIMSLAVTNKSRAVEIAFDQYWELLFQHAYRKVQSEDMAKDLVQEVFIVMWENVEKLAADSAILPYLYGILRNKILIQYRKDEVRLRYAVQHSGTEEKMSPSAHQLLLSKELQHIITDEVQKMPSKMQLIYRLKKEENCTIREIAEKLELSEQTVKNQLQNASGRLKLRLSNYDPSLLILGLIISGMAMVS